MRPGRFITRLESGTRTQQQYRDENNPNTIMRRYNSSGQITGRYRDKNAAAFVDCPATLEMYRQSRDLFLNVEATFADLPVRVRAHFGHSPEALLQALENPSRRDELEKIGILNPKTPVGTEPALAVKVPTGTNPTPPPAGGAK